MTEIQYNYDAINRLVEARFANGQILRYEYDPRGNRTSVIVTSPSTTRDAATNQVSVIAHGEQTQTPATATVDQSAQATLLEGKPGLANIIFLSGALENQHFPLGDQLRLGRGSDNDLTLPDKKASRRHAIIQRQGFVYQITDLNSGNGTYVNGKRITEPTLLNNNDIVIIGDTKLTISDQPYEKPLNLSEASGVERPAVKYCTRCGSVRNPGKRYCAVCGAPADIGAQ